MPRQPIEKYYSEKELDQMVNRINAFASNYSPWKVTHARREHQDLFGEVIKEGDHYCKYGRGPAFDDVIKLSALSMEKLCFALFESAVFLKPIADQILKQRQKRMFKAMSKLSILGNRKDEKRDRQGRSEIADRNFEKSIDSLATVGMLAKEAERFRRGRTGTEEVAERRSQAHNGSGARLCA